MTQKTEIDSSYIKASKTVSSLVWTLLNALDTNDAEPDALSNHDKDLLIDVLRYCTVAEVARVRKSTIEIIRKQYKDALSRLQPKVYTVEHIASLKTQLADAENKLYQQRKELIDSKARKGTEFSDSALYSIIHRWTKEGWITKEGKIFKKVRTKA